VTRQTRLAGRERLYNILTLIGLVVGAAALLQTAWAARDLPDADYRERRTVGLSPPTPPLDPLSLAGAWIQAAESAPLVLLVFSDFQCPFSAMFANRVLPEIEHRYVMVGRLRVAFRHLPLDVAHAHAFGAAEAAECAGAQGRFWEMHNELFHDPESLSPAALVRRAKRLGLDQDAFQACMAGTMRSRIVSDRDYAQRLEVTGTPTFVLGRSNGDGTMSAEWRRSGVKSIQGLSVAIEPLLLRVGDAP
jgi:protein-disulfide isomerase